MTIRLGHDGIPPRFHVILRPSQNEEVRSANGQHQITVRTPHDEMLLVHHDRKQPGDYTLAAFVSVEAAAAYEVVARFRSFDFFSIN